MKAYAARTVHLTDRMQEMLADPSALSPEDLLEAREGARQKRPRIADSRAVRDAFSALPEDDRQILYAHVVGGEPQAAIAERLGLKQHTVSWRLQRLTVQLRWLLGPGGRFSGDDVRVELDPWLTRGDVQVLALWWETTSQAETARRLRRSPDSVRRAIIRAVSQLWSEAEASARAARYAQGFLELWEAGTILSRRARRTIR